MQLNLPYIVQYFEIDYNEKENFIKVLQNIIVRQQNQEQVISSYNYQQLFQIQHFLKDLDYIYQDEKQRIYFLKMIIFTLADQLDLKKSQSLNQFFNQTI
ncbi:unnamed protein product [Paramecium sonneborni]|uniref:Uncharacterized protein n=1 Tax=Paramecium sonneborni TaxID=65129 RepID=A0A8S1M237_9CILI|nr:unnamed protein product [Paramecium sonneborni]